MSATTSDPYAVLHVAPHANAQTIRRAWLKLSKLHHPDRYPSDSQKQQATARLQQINAAYEQLSDPHQRRRVDSQRATALAHRAESRPATIPTVAGLATGFQNRNLPHRYTPGNRYVTFDGITYMNLAEAGRRIKQPVDRLQMYIANGELNAFEFDNQQWVTEASLIPLRTRHKSLRNAGPDPRATWRPIVPHMARPALAAPRSTPHKSHVGPYIAATAGRQYDAPRIDQRAAVVLNLAPTVFLAICGVLLYAYLANFSNVWPALTRLPEVLGM